jgi:hypothetical protein
LCCLSFFYWQLCCLSFIFWTLCCLSLFYWPLCCLSFDLQIFISHKAIWYLQTLLIITL